MRYFFIDPSLVTGPEVSITGTEAHHIKNVLRLKPGDGLKLFDGTGFEYEAAIVRVSARKVTVEFRGKAKAAAPSGAQIMVAQAFLKEKKMDDLVRQLCELGVAKWIPFFPSVPSQDPMQAVLPAAGSDGIALLPKPSNSADASIYRKLPKRFLLKRCWISAKYAI